MGKIAAPANTLLNMLGEKLLSKWFGAVQTITEAPIMLYPFTMISTIMPFLALTGAL